MTDRAAALSLELLKRVEEEEEEARVMNQVPSQNRNGPTSAGASRNLGASDYEAE